MIGAVVRIIAALISLACVVLIVFTDLDGTQRLLLAGIVIGSMIANWNSKP